jgi:hypothetical protein
VGVGAGEGIGVGEAGTGNLATSDEVEGEHKSGDREASVGGLVGIGEGADEFE